jgi:hypothetical protein
MCVASYGTGAWPRHTDGAVIFVRALSVKKLITLGNTNIGHAKHIGNPTDAKPHSYQIPAACPTRPQVIANPGFHFSNQPSTGKPKSKHKHTIWVASHGTKAKPWHTDGAVVFARALSVIAIDGSIGSLSISAIITGSLSVGATICHQALVI